MKIEIARIEYRQAEILQKISRQTFYETFSEMNSKENMDLYLQEQISLEKLKGELLDPDSEFWMASADGIPAGYLKINFGNAQTELKDSKSLEIERVYVLQVFQGYRIGQKLFDKAVNTAKDRKCNYVWLGVWEKNTGAINFYIKNGMTVFDSHIFRLGDDEQTDIMMKLKL